MFDLELKKVIEKIKSEDCSRVVIQLPDGLKPRAQHIVTRIEAETNASVFVWLTSCFGGCDLPRGLEEHDIDLVVQWGHNLFHKHREGW